MLTPLMSHPNHTKNGPAKDLKSFVKLVNFMMILTMGLVAAGAEAATRSKEARHQAHEHFSVVEAPLFGRRLGANQRPEPADSSAPRQRNEDFSLVSVTPVDSSLLRHRRHDQATSQDLAAADQLDEPTFTSPLEQAISDQERSLSDPSVLDNFGPSLNYQLDFASQRRQPNQRRVQQHRDSPSSVDNEEDESTENAQDSPDRNVFMNNHNSQLRAMRDMFERRHLDHASANNRHHRQQAAGSNPLQSSQELSPISIGLDPGPGSGMSPFQMGPSDGASPAPMGVHLKAPMSSADNLDANMGPALPFGLNPLPHLLGFQSTGFDGPQWGDQSAHSNHHAAAAPQPDSEMAGGGGGGSGGIARDGSSQKTWPKIFRFTDGRINLSDFEKQKKIRLSNKNQHGENHIESAPLMFDGRPLKRKSFLILHGGVFPGN